MVIKILKVRIEILSISISLANCIAIRIMFEMRALAQHEKLLRGNHLSSLVIFHDQAHPLKP
jgi:hypothetical protein